jgi:8-oxo-dGTP pyrophosphatase MutT (NUDIX family)
VDSLSVSLSLERIASRIAAHRAKDPLLAVPGRRAAVAAVLRFDRERPEILLMQRAEREGDRWSGHVSMPGGNASDGDADLLATAIRETREEVGLDLAAAARLLGRLDAVQAIARGKILPMTITPFVFALEDADAGGALALGPEAQAAFWLPLDDAARGALDGVFEYHLGPVPMSMPCWRFDGRVVWGLTYKMVGALLTLVQAPGPEPPTPAASRA